MSCLREIFRGGEYFLLTIKNLYSLVGTLNNFPTTPTPCSSSGLTFDYTTSSYASTTPYRFGGTMSVETYVKFSSFQVSSRIFDFGSGEGIGEC